MAAIIEFLLALIPFLFIRTQNAAVITSGFLGIGLAGVILLSDVLISDVIDYDRTRTGVRREGMYFGVNAFVCRFAIAMEAASIGLIFMSTRYNPIIFSQTKEFLMGLRILVAALPMAALSVAFGIMIFYPLSKSSG
jgi:GPH family glycoside/pentoside/hexuronide:cation symporter